MIIGKKIIVKTLADCKRIATFASYMKKVEMKRMFLLLTLVGTMTANVHGAIPKLHWSTAP